MLGLRTTIYKVDNLEMAKSWYSKVFKTEPYFDEPFYVGFNIKGYELGLMQQDYPGNKKTENILTYWGVEDIDTEYKRLISLGATEFEAPRNVGGEIMVAGVKDPWGNILGIIYNPEFKVE